MKKNLEIPGWILLFGFAGCVIWASVGTTFTANQYIATLTAAVVMGAAGTICLIVFQRNRNSKLTTRI